jgi:polysaccharide deacetylase 2 family uncharacterized protein YibQ
VLRALAWFWGPVLLVLLVGAVTLQWLGAPMVPVRAAAPRPALAAAGPRAPAPEAVAVGKPGAAIPPPDPALLAAAPDLPGAMIPRIGADGRQPMRVYAAGYDPSDRRPRIALLLSDIGMSGDDSAAAIATLPAAVSLAFSPYSDTPETLLAHARAAGHEILVSLPLEPQGAPLNDAGNQSLLTSASPSVNHRHLDWALSRIAGSVGATGAMGVLHGERFEGDAAQMTPVLRDLAADGLFYIDPLPHGGWSAPAAGRTVDLVVDDPALRTEIDAKLSDLERLAKENGAALGLVNEPAPVTVSRIAAWAAGLSQRGFVLVPVSALVQNAAKTP